MKGRRVDERKAGHPPCFLFYFLLLLSFLFVTLIAYSRLALEAIGLRFSTVLSVDERKAGPETEFLGIYKTITFPGHRVPFPLGVSLDVLEK